MIIKVTTPAFTVADVGPTSIVITLSRAGVSNLLIRDTEAYTLALSPPPLLLEESIRVQGRVAGEVWASKSTVTTVDVTV
jgi:hypothetical protein